MRARVPVLSLSCLMLVWSAPALAGAVAEDREGECLAGVEPAAVPRSPAASEPRAAELAVRRVVASYGQAIETRDVGLFRCLMPTLSSEAEERLRRAFRTSKARVVLTVDSVDIGGKSATVRTTRQDIVDGRQMELVQQKIQLALGADGWRIQSLSLPR